MEQLLKGFLIPMVAAAVFVAWMIKSNDKRMGS